MHVMLGSGSTPHPPSTMGRTRLGRMMAAAGVSSSSDVDGVVVLAVDPVVDGGADDVPPDTDA